MFRDGQPYAQRLHLIWLVYMNEEDQTMQARLDLLFDARCPVEVIRPRWKGWQVLVPEMQIYNGSTTLDADSIAQREGAGCMATLDAQQAFDVRLKLRNAAYLSQYCIGCSNQPSESPTEERFAHCLTRWVRGRIWIS